MKLFRAIEFQEISSQTLDDLDSVNLATNSKKFIKEYINEAKNREFPKKEYRIEGLTKSYTAVEKKSEHHRFTSS